MLMDPNKTLSEGQHLSTAAKITKRKNLLYREGIGSLTLTPSSYAEFSITINAITSRFLEDPVGAMYLEATKRAFQHLQGRESIRSISRDEENALRNLPAFQDPGGAPQHREVGYRPIMDEKSSLDQSKGARNMLSTMWRAKARAAADTVGIHAADADHPFWEMFPPAPEINKPPALTQSRTHT